jgi:hypothetical protein
MRRLRPNPLRPIPLRRIAAGPSPAGRLRRLLAARRLVAGGVAAALGLAGTAAWAYWSATGAGAGSAESGSMQAVTVTALVAGDQPGSALLPGGAAADVVLRVHNPNPYPVQVTSVAAAGAVSADAAHPACTSTGVTFLPPVNPQITVAAASTLLVDLPAAATMAASAPSGCQGATFAVPVTVLARR